MAQQYRTLSFFTDRAIAQRYICDRTLSFFTKNLILNRSAIALPPPLQQLRRHQTLRKKYRPQNNQQPKNN